MERLTFKYKGKDYSGELIRSENHSPHYYWLLLHDQELQEKFGDVAFKIHADNIEPVNELTSDKYCDLFHSMMTAIRSALFK